MFYGWDELFSILAALKNLWLLRKNSPAATLQNVYGNDDEVDLADTFGVND